MNTTIFEQHESAVRSYCRSFPAVFIKGKGAYMYDEEGNESSYKNYSTKNALIAAVFATICSVIGTILIIISSNRKTIEDDEEILS